MNTIETLKIEGYKQYLVEEEKAKARIGVQDEADGEIQGQEC